VCYILIVFGVLCLTVSKWRGEGVYDDFTGSQSGLDDMSYAGDPQRFLEVVRNFVF